MSNVFYSFIWEGVFPQCMRARAKKVLSERG